MAKPARWYKSSALVFSASTCRKTEAMPRACARLDKAALDAVRRWRWSPMLRDGQAVAVRGLVEIPFTLTPAR